MTFLQQKNLPEATIKDILLSALIQSSGEIYYHILYNGSDTLEGNLQKCEKEEVSVEDCLTVIRYIGLSFKDYVRDRQSSFLNRTKALLTYSLEKNEPVMMTFEEDSGFWYLAVGESASAEEAEMILSHPLLEIDRYYITSLNEDMIYLCPSVSKVFTSYNLVE